ncbi:MAG: hypothetical protein M3141_09675 [Actinomycetota bacterium]|nr:hypothetical protein [Actinomycetota bacterium]
MAVVESPETVGIRPFHEFDEANSLWPRGDRLEAIREGAERFRARFKEQGEVRAVRTVDLVSAGYPVKFAFGGAAKALNPFINIRNRLVVVRFVDFEGETRTLVWEPTVPEGSREAPFYAQISEKYGVTFAEKLGAKFFNTVEGALAKVGLTPNDVDFVSFDHLHVQDMRRLMGTTKPVDGDSVPKPPFFPNAKFLCQSKEVDTFRSLHPMQWAWYVPGGMDDVIEDNLVLLDGDVELGKGVALVWTPGHTDGNQSLCLNTPDGVWVSSENGVSADSWHPHLSRIPGVRRWAEAFGREVVMNANTLEDSVDQYDSMLKEKAVADANHDDPRWGNVFPSSELERRRRSWPVEPTYEYGGINYGILETPVAGRGGRLTAR